ncbi:hypothetical protein LEADMMO150B3_17945 [Leclercia adecarboxylata]|jgi:hypothetical protein
MAFCSLFLVNLISIITEHSPPPAGAFYQNRATAPGWKDTSRVSLPFN